MKTSTKSKDSRPVLFKLKSLLSPTFAIQLKKTIEFSKLLILRCVSWSPFLCSLYYTLFSSAFRREQKAVIAGLINHFSNADQDALSYQLRRNIHRIEKGLLMQPMKNLFALDYIMETVERFEMALRQKGDLNPEVVWAFDVLCAYFNHVSNHPLVSDSKHKFERLSIDLSNKSAYAPKIPYERNAMVNIPDYQQLHNLALRRRSVRWFLPKEVPMELIDQALAVAQQAPSACNRQPYKFRFFDNHPLLSKLRDIPLGTAGFAENIPMFCVVTGDLSAFFGERDRHGIYVDSSLAIMAFILALETLGLSSCPLNWPDIAPLERKMERILKLKRYERVIMCLAIGSPDPKGLVAFSQRKSVSEIRLYNET